MDTADELRTLRRRAQTVEDAADVVPRTHTGSPAVVGRVIDGGHIPTSVPNQYMVKPVRITGQLKEGLLGTKTVGTKPFICTVLGTRAPVVDDELNLRRIGGRWVGWLGLGTVPIGNVTVRVNGCSTLQGVEGCTVTLFDDATEVSTAVTDVNGNAVLPMFTPPVGTLTVEATAPDGSMVWDTPVVVGAVTFSMLYGLVSTIFLVPKSEFPICCGGSIGFVDPFELSGTLTDANGTHTISYHATNPYTAGPCWACCYTLPAAVTHHYTVGNNCLAGGSGDVAIGYILVCGSNWVLNQAWTFCPLGALTSLIPGACGGDFASHTTALISGTFASIGAIRNHSPGLAHGRDPFSVTFAGALVNGTVAVSFP